MLDHGLGDQRSYDLPCGHSLVHGADL